MHPEDGTKQPRLGIWRLHLSAAPRPLLFRRDEPFRSEADVVDVPDAMRYVSTARATLRGPLVLELDGPGDPLASAESTLRLLALIHEHHPDVLTGLVTHGPLLAEYTDELRSFGLGYVVLRLDAVLPATAERLIGGALYRGDKLERSAAATLYLEEARRALDVASAAHLPLAIRTTLVPTVNGREIEAIAREALRGGAQRMDILPHVPVPRAPLHRGGVPTEGELEEARDQVAEIFGPSRRRIARRGTVVTDWINPQRLQPVDMDALEAVEVMRVLPDPAEEQETARVLPPRRSQFIAVATRDGSLIDMTLAGAPQLRIYAVTNAHIKLLGTRTFEPNLQRTKDGVGNAQSFLKAVMGCRAVVTTGFSERAVTLLQAVGIKPISIAGPVEAVLDRVARGTLRQVT